MFIETALTISAICSVLSWCVSAMERIIKFFRDSGLLKVVDLLAGAKVYLEIAKQAQRMLTAEGESEISAGISS